MNWHQATVEEALLKQQSAVNGITPEESQQRLQQFGPNELTEQKRISPLTIFLGQFKDFMIIVLIIAAIISGALGDIVDTIVILLIVVINAVIGFVQEYRAEKAMQALKKMTTTSARVLRSGKVHKLPVQEMVPGDVVLLEAGDMIAADIRLMEAVQLKVEEASLTGESLPVDKITTPLEEADVPLGDRLNMAFKGTYVTNGRGKGLVVATGMQTELGKIARMLEEEDTKTPLQKRLTAFSKKLAVLVLLICAVVFGFGLLRGEEPLLMLLTAISLAVAAIPEALPSVVTIALAIGAKRMVRQNALVRKLPAVETLGSVTYICTDKTGTLTQNRMTVEQLLVGDAILDMKTEQQEHSPETEKLLQAMALNNDVLINEKGEPKGDPTEVALYELAAAKGFEKESVESHYPRVADLPFDSVRKCMSTIHQSNDCFTVITKGAIDVLLQKVNNVEAEKEVAGKRADKMAAEGLRVLGFAVKTIQELPTSLEADLIETNLQLVGAVGMMDPPREEAKMAVAECKSAGIQPIMITGDHPLTAKNIAERLGILAKNENAILSGTELNKLSEAEFQNSIVQTKVFARVSPEQKLNIVKALQANNQFVAMTGDGVNDAPSLKRSDIGIAMGITGTDVSKEASDLILLDDNFASIVKAVKSGRRIYDNIRKFIKYAMTGNVGEIWCIFLAPFFGLPIPLLPIHILWINLVTDGLPGLALAAEPAEKGIMQRPPRHPKESIFAGGLGTHILWVGLVMGLVTIATQSIFIDKPHWQTMAFTVLCFSQMGHVFAIRSDDQSLFSMGLFSNKSLLGAVLLTLLLQLAIIYIPVFNAVFHTAPLTWEELGITLALSSIVFFLVEAEKVWKRTRNKKN